MDGRETDLHATLEQLAHCEATLTARLALEDLDGLESSLAARGQLLAALAADPSPEALERLQHAYALGDQLLRHLHQCRSRWAAGFASAAAWSQWAETWQQQNQPPADSSLGLDCDG